MGSVPSGNGEELVGKCSLLVLPVLNFPESSQLKLHGNCCNSLPYFMPYLTV